MGDKFVIFARWGIFVGKPRCVKSALDSRKCNFYSVSCSGALRSSGCYPHHETNIIKMMLVKFEEKRGSLTSAIEKNRLTNTLLKGHKFVILN